MNATIIIFLLVYLVMGLGKLPGFKVDRTGAAVIGGLAMMAVGSIDAKAAWDAIDYRTMGLLFGLMIVSGAFAVSGFYGWAAHRMANMNVSPSMLLAVMVAVSGFLSAILTNDVVVVAMTPLLISITLARGLNPVPFLLAFCFAANAGSAGTLIGSPQNMIVAQGLDMSFNSFLTYAGLPALLSLPLVWAIVAWMYRNRWQLKNSGQAIANTSEDSVGSSPTPQQASDDSPRSPDTTHSASGASKATGGVHLDITETIKATVITVAVVVAFIVDIWPQELVALTAAGILLINRRIASGDVLGHVDGNLLLLIGGLFVINAAVASTGLPQILLGDLKAAGVDLSNPMALLLSSAALSNIVGNSPAVMLLVPLLEPAAGHSQVIGAALALGTGFSSNLIIFGSLAGIIIVEQSARAGVTISFKEFALAGVPVGLACLLMSALWIMMLQ